MTNLDGFQIRAADVMGRIGELGVPGHDAPLETPVLFPVVNPHLQVIEPRELKKYTQGIITNAYILHQSTDLRNEALKDGVHALLDFEGVVMTDSGSFQLAEYGEIDVTTEEILSFQQEIGSDIATPIDIPTPPDASREQAENELCETLNRLEFADTFKQDDMLLTAPIQGAVFEDLREQAARSAYETTLDIFPIGGVVPLLREYRFPDIVRVTLAVKRGLGEDVPVHLFGAGHPMMFALAVSLGCDVFDSAAYALYARDDRYMTVTGTKHLDSLNHFPCACPVCTATTPTALRNNPPEDRYQSLAWHNLHVSFAEINRVKQAIRDGKLLELVEQRTRSHPSLLDGYREALSFVETLEQCDPIRKGTFFYVSSESASRPEVTRYQRRLDRLNPPGDLVLSRNPTVLKEHTDKTTWEVSIPFGPVPPSLAETHPVSGEFPENTDLIGVERSIQGINKFVQVHSDVAVTIIASEWPEQFHDIFREEIEMDTELDVSILVSGENE